MPSLVCPLCSSSVPPSRLEKHIRRELDYAAFACRLCGHHFLTAADARAHFRFGLRHPKGTPPQILEDIDEELEEKVSLLLDQATSVKPTHNDPQDTSDQNLGIAKNVSKRVPEGRRAESPEPPEYLDEDEAEAHSCLSSFASSQQTNAGLALRNASQAEGSIGEQGSDEVHEEDAVIGDQTAPQSVYEEPSEEVEASEDTLKGTSASFVDDEPSQMEYASDEEADESGSESSSKPSEAEKPRAEGFAVTGESVQDGPEETSPATSPYKSFQPVSARISCLLCSATMRRSGWQQHAARHAAQTTFRCERCDFASTEWTPAAAQGPHSRARHPGLPRLFEDLRPKLDLEKWGKLCFGAALPGPMARPLPKAPGVGEEGHLTVLTCGLCHKLVKRRSWRCHVSRQHLRQPTFACPICPFRTRAWQLNVVSEAGHCELLHPGQGAALVDQREPLVPRLNDIGRQCFGDGVQREGPGEGRTCALCQRDVGQAKFARPDHVLNHHLRLARAECQRCGFRGQRINGYDFVMHMKRAHGVEKFSLKRADPFVRDNLGEIAPHMRRLMRDAFGLVFRMRQPYIATV